MFVNTTFGNKLVLSNINIKIVVMFVVLLTKQTCAFH